METLEFLQQQCEYAQEQRPGVYIVKVEGDWHLIVAGSDYEANNALNALANAKHREYSYKDTSYLNHFADEKY